MNLLGTIVAPTTLLTSLLFYFGWSHAYYFYDYFGVNSTLLDLSTRDDVQKAVDGLFVPLLVLAGAGLLAVWAYSLLRARLALGPPRHARRLVAGLAAVGLVLALRRPEAAPPVRRPVLLLPETWSRRSGVAILIPRNDSLRLELVPASARGTARPTAC